MKLNNLLRLLPNFKGKQRLVRFFFDKFIHKKKDAIIDGNYNLQYKLPNCIEVIGFEIFINGIYEKETSNLIINKIPDNGVYLDVGANIGGVVLPVCKKRPDIAAICIEASTRIFNYLKFNFELNKLSNYTLINKAVSDKDGEVLNLSDQSEQFGKGYITNTNSEKTEAIETVKIDSVLRNYNLQKVDVLKVDIEGYEYFAFKGAESLLCADNAPDIIFEFEDWAEKRAINLQPGDAQKLLMKYGYSLFWIDKGKLNYIEKPITKGSVMIWASKKIA